MQSIYIETTIPSYIAALLVTPELFIEINGREEIK
jgi:hypothetical protein